MTLFPDTKDNIIINVPKTISSAPLIELDGEKIDGRLIKIEFFDDHIMTMAEFVNGGIQVFMTGFSQGLSYYKTSHDIVMISNPVWGVSLLLTNDPKINDITGFQGKTILVPFAKSPLDLQLKAILKKKGLLDKVAVDFAPIQQQVPMLISQKAAGICIPEPLASKLIHDKNAYKVFSFSEEWASVNGNDPRSPQVSIFVKKEFAASNKKFFIDLNKAIVKKINFIKKDPDGISKKYSSVFSLDHDIIKSSLKNVILEIPDLKTEKKICVSYEKAIEDQDVINDDFFFEY
jgi:ABC-type nitrate/sulfonate/bicarbonate transport system substrate-binding protein